MVASTFAVLKNWFDCERGQRNSSATKLSWSFGSTVTAPATASCYLLPTIPRGSSPDSFVSKIGRATKKHKCLPFLCFLGLFAAIKPLVLFVFPRVPLHGVPP